MPGRSRVLLCLVCMLAVGRMRAATNSAVASPDVANVLTLRGAVLLALDQNPYILIQKQEVKVSEGNARSALGQFDVSVKGDVSRGHEKVPQVSGTGDVEDIETDKTTYDLSATRQFGNGISVSPGVSADRTDLHGEEPVSTASTISFSMTVPLLRGLGSRAVLADKLSEDALLDGARYTLRHVVSKQVLTTVQAYWSCIQEERSISLARETENRARELVSLTESLVAADIQPQACRERVLANLEQAVASRFQTEQNAVNSRMELALSLGLRGRELLDAPVPADKPEVSGAPVEKALVRDMVEYATIARNDLQAAKKEIESGAYLVDARRNALKPKLDLTVSGGYAGVDDGDGFGTYYRATLDNLRGPNLKGSLSLEWPVQNNTACGLYVSQVASVEKSRLSMLQIEDQVISGVISYAQIVNAGFGELDARRKARSYYMTAVDNEKEMYKRGMSTVTDVITALDKLAQAQTDELAATVNLLNNIAQLRFVSGCLVLWSNGDDSSIMLCNMIAPPTRKEIDVFASVGKSASSGKAFQGISKHQPLENKHNGKRK